MGRAALEVICAATAPFTRELEVDFNGSREALRSVSEHVDRVLIGGTTGEFPALETRERLALVEVALEELGPSRVIAHVGAPDARTARRLAVDACRSGVICVAAITPYFLAATFAEVHRYYETLCDDVDVPVYAYIFTERTGVTVTPEELTVLVGGAGVAGAKLSGRASADIAEYVAAADGAPVYSGDDGALEKVWAAGGAGIVSGCSSALPRPFIDLARRVATGESDSAGSMTVARVVSTLGPSIGRIKYAQAALGLHGAHARMTVGAPDPSAAATIDALIADVTEPGRPNSRGERPVRRLT